MVSWWIWLRRWQISARIWKISPGHPFILAVEIGSLFVPYHSGLQNGTRQSGETIAETVSNHAKTQTSVCDWSIWLKADLNWGSLAIDANSFKKILDKADRPLSRMAKIKWTYNKSRITKKLVCFLSLASSFFKLITMFSTFNDESSGSSSDCLREVSFDRTYLIKYSMVLLMCRIPFL
ncbi:hypothetical protein OGAPHI_005876 [Ogataea philodendri]|uniref:Uncharacterized protein n=1 Tax=Ogataea philodendri TaxID=1378263 RepID=A0A9P8P0W5_9ASCO|nr:uncharacterized protein OGAPHI_005876 [Ogataea philodendri]KAH3662624.1 hypothetical protein OGAPHI_005876 [Ogataea philodendri]